MKERNDGMMERWNEHMKYASHFKEQGEKWNVGKVE
jgi:hypothetical protein